jgi:CRISPR-associated protein (Cas_Csd1)
MVLSLFQTIHSEGKTDMQISLVAPPDGIEYPYGYAPMDVGIEILIGIEGQIGPAVVMPTELDNQIRKRLWLPDLPRTSGVAPIVGSDKLDYYHPNRKPQAHAAMVKALEQLKHVLELGWILDWMKSEKPLELEDLIAKRSKGDATKLEGGRIVWRLTQGPYRYIHELPAIQKAHAAKTLEQALSGGQDELLGPLPKVHSKKLATPLLGCNDEMFCAWGQGEKVVLNVSAETALIATQRYTQLLETKGHHIRVGIGRYWVWGALPEMAQISDATKNIANFFGSDGADLDPIQTLQDLIAQVQTGAKGIGKIPEDLKIAFGYIGLGGSGIGRAAIGQMTEQSALELLINLLTYHQRQRRYIVRSTPYWVFGLLTVAEGSSKSAISKANEQIFEAMISGSLPSAAITNLIIQRLKIEGIPNALSKKSNREWSQIAYLAWIAPEFIEGKSTIMKPQTTPDNLLAWHVGRVFASCKTMAYHYAARAGTPSADWKNPMDAYRQTLFGSPAQGFTQIMSKVSPYLSARPDKAIWYHKTLEEMGEDCPGKTVPKRWTDEQAFFLALGISQIEAKRFAKKPEEEEREEVTQTTSAS